jgi:hypothetical protein
VGVFEERLTHALGDAAMGPSLEDHWIDGAADIVDRNEMDDLDGAGFSVSWRVQHCPRHYRTSPHNARKNRALTPLLGRT